MVFRATFPDDRMDFELGEVGGGGEYICFLQKLKFVETPFIKRFCKNHFMLARNTGSVDTQRERCQHGEINRAGVSPRRGPRGAGERARAAAQGRCFHLFYPIGYGQRAAISAQSQPPRAGPPPDYLSWRSLMPENL